MSPIVAAMEKGLEQFTFFDLHFLACVPAGAFLPLVPESRSVSSWPYYSFFEFYILVVLCPKKFY